MGPSTDDALTEVARELLARFGADLTHAARPDHGWSNEVWIAEHVVVRLSRGADGSMPREAALASILPAEVGYPAVLGYGTVRGVEWMAAERLPGSNLGEVWPRLDQAARTRAVEDLWTRLRAVHRTDVDRARALGCTSTPFYALDENAASTLLRSLTDLGALEPALSRRLGEILERGFRAMALVPRVLSHTDAGPHNTVWSDPGSDASGSDGSRSDSQAVPVDFEFACVAPADLDLEHLLRTLSFDPGPDPSGYLLGLADDLLTAPGAPTRLWAYAVLRDLWGLRGWWRTAQARGDLATWGADAGDLRTWAPWLHLDGHVHRTSWLADHLP